MPFPPTVDQCCCGCDLKTGTIITGAISLVIIVIVIITIIIVIITIIIVIITIMASIMMIKKGTLALEATLAWVI